MEDSRAQFVSSLGRRLEALRLALVAVEQSPRSAAHRDNLRRRIHAFGAAAGVLGFDRVFDAFREAETVLARVTVGGIDANDLSLVGRTIDLVPSLVMGTDVPVSRRPGSIAPTAVDRRGAFPTSVLVFGAAPLVESLSAPGPALGTPALEFERTEDPERAEELVRVMAPDVAVIDADRQGSRELMETLVYDPLLDPIRIIAIGTFDRPEAAASLVALGVARVLPKPVSPDTLKRSVLEVARERAVAPTRGEPIGDVTVESLGERLAQEFQRGLVDAVRAQSRGFTVSFGEGTDVLAAVWASVARIRELVTMRSGGAVRFDSSGPEGAVPLVPWMGEERHRGATSSEQRSFAGVSLEGRVIVVADDDPAIAWFLSGLLRAVGAEVLEAHDGERALELVRDRWPDLVVSDVLMPGLDGFALCREIKRDIALSDVPVILLSWKEDLLQRVRELGAEADGYLRKEATASTVVQRAKEVLMPRARIEARMAGAGEVRGRLDGVTPRLILELVTKKGENARVSVRDAGFLYEVHVRQGRVRGAVRTSSTGRSERGERVLAALLGVRAGRFAVQRDESETPNEWNGDLRELLAMPVDRARAAGRALADLGRVTRVDLDASALEPYLGATPQSAREIVQRLRDGASPDDIVAAGVPARLLESVLGDAVLHGAVLRVVGRDGNDAFARELAEGRKRRSEPPSIATTFSPSAPAVRVEPRALQLSPSVPAAAVSESVASLRVATPAPAYDRGGRDPFQETSGGSASAGTSRPAPSAVSTSVVPAIPSTPVVDDPDAAFASLLMDSVMPPADDAPPESKAASRPFAMKGMAPPISLPPEPSPLETALRSLPAPFSLRIKGADEEPSVRPARATSESTSAMVAASSAPEANVEAAPTLAPKSNEAANAAEATKAESKIDGAVKTGDAAKTDAAGADAKLDEAAKIDDASDGSGTADDEPPESSARRLNPPRPESRLLKRDGEDPAIDLSTVVMSLLGSDAAVTSPPPASDAVVRATTSGPTDLATTLPSPRPAPPESSEAPAAVAKAPVIEPISMSATFASATSEPTQSFRKKTPEASSSSSTAAVAPATKAKSTKTPAVAEARARTKDKAPASAKQSEGSGAGSTLAMVALTAVAAAASFALVNALRGNPAPASPPAAATTGATAEAIPTTAQTAPPTAAPPPTAPTTGPTGAPPPVPSGAAPTTAAPPSASGSVPTITPVTSSMATADLDLPEGIAVPPDRGLLEVDVDSPRSIYVDGVFIGRGPMRRLPLREGQHEVKLRGDDGSEAAQAVAIHKGRRTRLGVSNSR